MGDAQKILKALKIRDGDALSHFHNRSSWVNTITIWEVQTYSCCAILVEVVLQPSHMMYFSVDFFTLPRQTLHKSPYNYALISNGVYMSCLQLTSREVCVYSVTKALKTIEVGFPLRIVFFCLSGRIRRFIANRSEGLHNSLSLGALWHLPFLCSKSSKSIFITCMVWRHIFITFGIVLATLLSRLWSPVLQNQGCSIHETLFPMVDSQLVAPDTKVFLVHFNCE